VINVGDEVEIVGIRDTRKSVCTGVEMFRKLLDRGEAGDNVGILLRGIDREGVERGQVRCKPKSVMPHTKFEAKACMMPGNNLKFNVELIAPIAMKENLRFAIREGGRTVDAGVVSKIIP